MDIQEQSQLDDIIKSIDWHHAFIRELYLVSPSYYLPDSQSTVAADALPDVYILICTCDPAYSHIEFILHETERLYVPCYLDIEPTGTIKCNHVEIRFSLVDHNATIARGISISRLGDEVGGWNLRYGVSNPFDAAGFRDKEEPRWSQESS